MDSTIPPPAPGWPSRKSRRRVGLFVAGFVALQLLIPLTHLLPGSPQDGRFTWRDWPGSLQSSPGSCSLEAWREHRDGSREQIELQRMVHEDWLDRAGHNEDVVEALLRKQCESDDIVLARLVQECVPDQEPRDFQLRCAGGSLQGIARTASR